MPMEVFYENFDVPAPEEIQPRRSDTIKRKQTEPLEVVSKWKK